MNTPATDCAVSVAYWFLQRADKDSSFLETNKLQHLLFLSQVNFASKNNMETLMPCVFVCDKDGFSEPNLTCILSQGRPFMPPVKFNEIIENFLETIWVKYAAIPNIQLTNFIKNTQAYKDNYYMGTKNIVSLKSVVESFAASSNISNTRSVKPDNKKKILLSQNGPVLVSKWQPRKIEPNEIIKGE